MHAEVNEEWRDVPDTQGYQVSDLGNMRTRRYIVNRSRTELAPSWRPMVPGKHPFGYHMVALNHAGRTQRRLVHRLVMRVFVGPCPSGMEVCHNNGDPSDNRLSNLRYATRKENCADKKMHGTWQDGEKAGSHKLKEHQVVLVKGLLRLGIGQSVIGRYIGVTNSTIWTIDRGTRWSQVPTPEITDEMREIARTLAHKKRKRLSATQAELKRVEEGK